MVSTLLLVKAGISAVISISLMIIVTNYHKQGASCIYTKVPYTEMTFSEHAPAWCSEWWKELQASDRSEYTGEFAGELEMILNYYRCRIPFAFSRYGDGELFLIQGESVHAQVHDHWSWEGGKSKVGDALRHSLRICDQDYFIGLPCEDWKDSVDAFFRLSSQRVRYISYATAFINRNYERFSKFMKEEVMTQTAQSTDIVLIVNERVNQSNFPWARKVYTFPDEFVTAFEADSQKYIEKFKTIAGVSTGVTFLISGGPPAKALIRYMWEHSPRNQYIDVGSALDEFTKGFITRPYADKSDGGGDYYRNHYCKRYHRGRYNHLELMPRQ